MADPVAKTAVGSRQNSFAAYQAGIANQPFGHQIRVLNEVAAVTNDARNKCSTFGQLNVFEDAPFVFMAWVRRLDRKAHRSHPQDNVSDIAERNIVVVGPVETAPTNVQANLIRRDIAKRMVEGVDPHGGVDAIFRNTHLRQAIPTVW